MIINALGADTKTELDELPSLNTPPPPCDGNLAGENGQDVDCTNPATWRVTLLCQHAGCTNAAALVLLCTDCARIANANRAVVFRPL